MAHPSQREFCVKTIAKHPEQFTDKDVLDVGSCDVNGNNRGLFPGCRYIGIDVAPGNNVDHVSLAHMFYGSFDVVVSTSALEHDPYWEKTLLACYGMLRPGGSYLLTCAGPGWPEHGTDRVGPSDSKLHSVFSEHSNYYRNISAEDFCSILKPEMFNRFELEMPRHSVDSYITGECYELFFFGVKG